MGTKIFNFIGERFFELTLGITYVAVVSLPVVLVTMLFNAAVENGWTTGQIIGLLAGLVCVFWVGRKMRKEFGLEMNQTECGRDAGMAKKEDGTSLVRGLGRSE